MYPNSVQHTKYEFGYFVGWKLHHKKYWLIYYYPYKLVISRNSQPQQYHSWKNVKRKIDKKLFGFFFLVAIFLWLALLGIVVKC